MVTNKNTKINSLEIGDCLHVMEEGVSMVGQIMLIDYVSGLVVLTDEFGPSQFDLNESSWVSSSIH